MPFSSRMSHFKRVELPRQLRRDMTDSEYHLWQALRGRWGFLGARWHRQVPMAGYIVDFWCPRFSLAVEVDGRAHIYQTKYDQQRDAQISVHGVRVLRIPASLVLEDRRGVLALIADVARDRHRVT